MYYSSSWRDSRFAVGAVSAKVDSEIKAGFEGFSPG